MLNNLSNLRKSYQKSKLTEEQCPENPMDLFQQWFLDASESKAVLESNTMTISTIGLDNFPKSRVVLLKKYSEEGFVFYTNYNSEKGKSIEQNNSVCLSFFWEYLERQIIIKGKAQKLAENLSDQYFESRPRDSKIGAWASNQSQVIFSSEQLHKKFSEIEKKYENEKISRPPHWGGYIVKPINIEFWQGRPSRMHDRILYRLEKDFSWKMERLEP